MLAGAKPTLPCSAHPLYLKSGSNSLEVLGLLLSFASPRLPFCVLLLVSICKPYDAFFYKMKLSHMCAREKKNFTSGKFSFCCHQLMSILWTAFRTRVRHIIRIYWLHQTVSLLDDILWGCLDGIHELPFQNIGRSPDIAARLVGHQLFGMSSPPHSLQFIF